MPTDTYTATELDRYRSVQKLAYACAERVAGQLRPGMTERDAVVHLRNALRDHGVREYFHQPFAWFGDRTSFTGVRWPLDFLPTRRKLKPGMAVILDVAPVVDGVAADIAYSFALGKNERLDQVMADLRVLRQLVLEQVRRERSQAEICRATDALLDDLGYTNCHARYPFRALAHRIPRLPAASWPHRLVVGFGLPSAARLFGYAILNLLKLREKSTPFWNEGKSSQLSAEPGLWAVEPHIGREDVGAKWEEMLVVTESTAYWLDDDLPHVRPRH